MKKKHKRKIYNFLKNFKFNDFAKQISDAIYYAAPFIIEIVLTPLYFPLGLLLYKLQKNDSCNKEIDGPDVSFGGYIMMCALYFIFIPIIVIEILSSIYAFTIGFISYVLIIIAFILLGCIYLALLDFLL